MKKISLLLLISLIISSISLNAQKSETIIATFSSAEKVVVKAENITSSYFSVAISSEMLKEMQTKVTNYNPSIEFVYTEDSKIKGTFHCVLNIDHSASAIEFYKPFYIMGITKLNINKKEHGLDYLMTMENKR